MVIGLCPLSPNSWLLMFFLDFSAKTPCLTLWIMLEDPKAMTCISQIQQWGKPLPKIKSWAELSYKYVWILERISEGSLARIFNMMKSLVCLPMIILVVYRMHLILGQNLYTHIIFMPLLFSKWENWSLGKVTNWPIIIYIWKPKQQHNLSTGRYDSR